VQDDAAGAAVREALPRRRAQGGACSRLQREPAVGRRAARHHQHHHGDRHGGEKASNDQGIIFVILCGIDYIGLISGFFLFSFSNLISNLITQEKTNSFLFLFSVIAHS
jgi:hypothetical protein